MQAFEITLNAEPHSVGLGTTIGQLLGELKVDARRVAVEVNQQLVPRSHHDSRQLQPGDQLEIVTLVGGG